MAWISWKVNTIICYLLYFVRFDTCCILGEICEMKSICQLWQIISFLDIIIKPTFEVNWSNHLRNAEFYFFKFRICWLNFPPILGLLKHRTWKTNTGIKTIVLFVKLFSAQHRVFITNSKKSLNYKRMMWKSVKRTSKACHQPSADHLTLIFSQQNVNVNHANAFILNTSCHLTLIKSQLEELLAQDEYNFNKHKKRGK